ncbi:hypothetical protein AX16_003059 [Volvariella volvacea WC 439]|nr:hypothetical protein AX16_003059 [Volvariella volvacea WC 439]
MTEQDLLLAPSPSHITNSRAALPMASSPSTSSLALSTRQDDLPGYFSTTSRMPAFGSYIAFKINPQISIANLDPDDEILRKATLNMKPQTYVGLFIDVHSMDFSRPWLSIRVALLARDTQRHTQTNSNESTQSHAQSGRGDTTNAQRRPDLPKWRIDPKHIIPVLPVSSQPTTTSTIPPGPSSSSKGSSASTHEIPHSQSKELSAPLSPNKPLPWPDCYHPLNLTPITVRIKNEMGDRRGARIVPVDDVCRFVRRRRDDWDNWKGNSCGCKGKDVERDARRAFGEPAVGRLNGLIDGISLDETDPNSSPWDLFEQDASSKGVIECLAERYQDDGVGLAMIKEKLSAEFPTSVDFVTSPTSFDLSEANAEEDGDAELIQSIIDVSRTNEPSGEFPVVDVSYDLGSIETLPDPQDWFEEVAHLRRIMDEAKKRAAAKPKSATLNLPGQSRSDAFLQVKMPPARERAPNDSLLSPSPMPFNPGSPAPVPTGSLPPSPSPIAVPSALPSASPVSSPTPPRRDPDSRSVRSQATNSTPIATEESNHKKSWKERMASLKPGHKAPKPAPEKKDAPSLKRENSSLQLFRTWSRSSKPTA